MKKNKPIYEVWFIKKGNAYQYEDNETGNFLRDLSTARAVVKTMLNNCEKAVIFQRTLLEEYEGHLKPERDGLGGNGETVNDATA